MVYRSHGHLLGCRQERGLGLLVTHRLYAAAPLDVVDAEYGLIQCQRDGNRHESVVLVALELLQEVERGVERQRTARKPDVL